eukprot:GSA25T00010324001.1
MASLGGLSLSQHSPDPATSTRQGIGMGPAGAAPQQVLGASGMLPTKVSTLISQLLGFLSHPHVVVQSACWRCLEAIFLYSSFFEEARGTLFHARSPTQPHWSKSASSPPGDHIFRPQSSSPNSFS